MTKRRWLKSVIAASQEQVPALPFQRTNRRKPVTLKPGVVVTARPTTRTAS